MSDNPFNANWSSKGNTLCLGHWDITYLGLPVTLPIERRDKDMGTNNIYNFMDPEDELYREGLMEDDWIVENIDWLSDVFIEHNIPLEEETMRAFYQAVNKEDWRCVVVVDVFNSKVRSILSPFLYRTVIIKTLGNSIFLI